MSQQDSLIYLQQLFFQLLLFSHQCCLLLFLHPIPFSHHFLVFNCLLGLLFFYAQPNFAVWIFRFKRFFTRLLLFLKKWILFVGARFRGCKFFTIEAFNADIVAGLPQICWRLTFPIVINADKWLWVQNELIEVFSFFPRFLNHTNQAWMISFQSFVDYFFRRFFPVVIGCSSLLVEVLVPDVHEGKQSETGVLLICGFFVVD